MCIDINNFYFGTPLAWYEYLCITITLILDKIICQYKIFPFIRNGFIYLEIHKGMYGFTQSGCLAYDLLTKKNLPKDIYNERTHEGYCDKNDDTFGDALSLCLRYIDTVALVVKWGCADVPTLLAM